MAPFIQISAESQSPTPSANTTTGIENHETLYFALLMALSGTMLLLSLLGLGRYLFVRRQRARLAIIEASMIQEIEDLRLAVRSLERQLNCCTCTKRIPWERIDRELDTRDIASESHAVHRSDSGEFVLFDASEIPQSSFATASDQEKGVIGQAVSTDVRGEHTTHPPSSGSSGKRRRSSTYRELQELNRSRVRYLQSVPEVDETDTRFVVGEESESERGSLPPRPENPLARSPPPSDLKGASPFSGRRNAYVEPATPTRRLA